MASIEGCGLWPVDADRAITSLNAGETKRKELAGARQSFADVPVVTHQSQLTTAFQDHGVRQLRYEECTLFGVRVGTVPLSQVLKVHHHVTRSSCSRGTKGVTHGSILACDEVIAELEE